MSSTLATSFRVMLFIDADNVSGDVIAQAIDKVMADHGAIHVRRAHCTAEAAVKHAKLFKSLSIRPIVNLASGKNSTDIALAADAMEMVCAERPNLVVIVSSDSDFAPLVIRLREKGCRVCGIGQRGKTGDEVVEVYDEFIDFEHRKPPPLPRSGSPLPRNGPPPRARGGRGGDRAAPPREPERGPSRAGGGGRGPRRPAEPRGNEREGERFVEPLSDRPTDLEIDRAMGWPPADRGPVERASERGPRPPRGEQRPRDERPPTERDERASMERQADRDARPSNARSSDRPERDGEDDERLPAQGDDATPRPEGRTDRPPTERGTGRGRHRGRGRSRSSGRAIDQAPEPLDLSALEVPSIESTVGAPVPEAIARSDGEAASDAVEVIADEEVAPAPAKRTASRRARGGKAARETAVPATSSEPIEAPAARVEPELADIPPTPTPTKTTKPSRPTRRGPAASAAPSDDAAADVAPRKAPVEPIALPTALAAPPAPPISPATLAALAESDLPGEVQRLLEAIPELLGGAAFELSHAAERLRATGLLAKNAPSTKLFKQYPDLFVLTPGRQPNKVRFSGPVLV